MSRSFVHLHVHSEYSLLQSSARIKDLARIAGEQGSEALAITDYGAMFGAIELTNALKGGPKPIFGFEGMHTVGSRHNRRLQPVQENHTLVFLAKTFEGYEALMKLSSRGHTEGSFQDVPRIDDELLNTYHRDVIAILPQARGRLKWHLKKGERQQAHLYIRSMIERYGRENVFLEVLNHGLSEEVELNQVFREMAREEKIELVATNDVYYTRREDAEAHEILMAIREKMTLSDPRRPRMPSSEYFFKSPDEMWALFEGYEDACENTLRIAGMCNAGLKFGELYLPRLPLPEDVTRLDSLSISGTSDVSGLENADWVEAELDREIRSIALNLFPLELRDSEKLLSGSYRSVLVDKSIRPSESLTLSRLQKLPEELGPWLRTLCDGIEDLKLIEGDEDGLFSLVSSGPVDQKKLAQVLKRFEEMAVRLCPIGMKRHSDTIWLDYGKEQLNPQKMPEGAPARLLDSLKEIPFAIELRRFCLKRIPFRYEKIESSIREVIEAQEKANKEAGSLIKPLDIILDERLDFELNVIKIMGFSAYFLIVADFINASKDVGIPVGPGRGSAAGALVAYLTGITDICPLRYGLYFERFLNPERISMPDIDIDFCFRRREESIEYCRKLYGDEKVAHIVTFGRLKTKAVLKDVARVLEVPFQEANEISKAVPEDPKIKNLDMALEASAELRRWADQYPQLFDVARRLANLARQTGLHAAGIVISPDDVDAYVPVCGSGTDRATQFDGGVLESQGLLKMDFLGLSTLTVIQDAVQMIRKSRGIELDINEIPLDDPKVFDMLCRAHTAGLFQVDSRLFQGILRDMQPKRFEDIIALVALGRPGPLGSGMVDTYCEGSRDASTVTYPHAMLEELLEETYGVILYQEQVMNSAVILAGYTMAQADQLRRAMGKKKPEEMKMHRDIFMSGGLKRGIPEEKSSEIFDLIAKFAEYGFNKSHSACYGMICYQTCWLKANYPAEFMAAAMTDKIDNQVQLAYLHEDCKRMGIEFLPADINQSELYFSVRGEAIVYGLGAVKEVGTRAVETMIAGREKKPYQSLRDFCSRLDPALVSKKAIENLIKVGAFDSLGGQRGAYLEVLDRYVAESVEFQRTLRSGQRMLFKPDFSKDDLPRKTISSRVEELAWEKALTGIWFSGHPLDEYRLWLESACQKTIRDVLDGEDGPVVLGGMISGFERRINKDGEDWIRFRLSDFSASIDCMVYAREFKRVTFKVLDDQVVVVYGMRRQSSGNFRPGFQAQEMELVPRLHDSARWNLEFNLYLQSQDVTDELIRQIKYLVAQKSGKQKLGIFCKTQGYEVELGMKTRIEASLEGYRQLADALGSSRLGIRLMPPVSGR